MHNFDFTQAHSAKILVAITFHYDTNRLIYLAKVLASLARFPVTALRVVIITNTEESQGIHTINTLCHDILQADKQSYYLGICRDLEHPFLLTWCHKSIIADEFFSSSENYTHFIYLEDDIELSFLNFCYFVTYREILQEKSLIPSFLRVEFSHSLQRYVSSDSVNTMELSERSTFPIIRYGEYLFVNAYNFYTAFFILDRELAQEYVTSRSFSMHESSQVSHYEIRERAAMGLSFENIPPGYSSRYVVPICIKNATSPLFSWVYHLPNNCANKPNVHGFGTLPMGSLFRFHSSAE